MHLNQKTAKRTERAGRAYQTGKAEELSVPLCVFRESSRPAARRPSSARGILSLAAGKIGPKNRHSASPRGGGKPRAGFSCIVPQGFPARKGKAKGLGKEEVFTAFFLILVLTERKKPAVFKFLENFAFILWRGESFCFIMKKPVSPEIWAEAPLFSLILLRKRNRSE